MQENCSDECLLNKKLVERFTGKLAKIKLTLDRDVFAA